MTDTRATPRKYVPVPEELNLRWHRAAVESGAVPLQRCTACGRFRHPPRYYCPECFSGDWELVPAAGTGTVYSHVVSHRSFDPAWADETPFGTVAVQLDEGPRVIGALRGQDPTQLAIGQRVRVSVEPRTEEFAFVWVEPEP